MASADAKSNCEIRILSKGKPPRLPFAEIKDVVLGKKYKLSIVFIGDSLSRTLNATYRNKNKPTNVLSFSLENNEGEIFINLKKAREESPLFKEKTNNFIGYLFIHGLLHLKGFDHGSRMEEMERKIRRKFNL